MKGVYSKSTLAAIPPTVISKETFRRDFASLPHYDTLIIDEAETCLGVTPNTRWRNKKEIPRASQLFEAVCAYVEKHKPERIYLCTATITRSPMCVWAVAKVLGYGWDYFRFRQAFYVRLPMPGREVWMPKKTEEAKDHLAKCVRTIGHVGRLEDWFDVPAQVYRDVYVDLNGVQESRIRKLRTEFPDPLVQLGKRLQVENGVLNGDEFNQFEEFSNAKLDKIVSYSYEFPKMIVFAKYTLQILQIYEALKKESKHAVMMTGETTDRGTLLKDFEEAKEGVLIVQSQISAGWEVPSCPVMIFASRTYSISDYLQGQGRIQRANALKKNLYINLIVRGGIDEAVHETLSTKKDFSERVYLGYDGTK